MLPSDMPKPFIPAKLLDISFQPVDMVIIPPLPIAWSIQWFLYLSQRLKLLSNVKTEIDADQIRSHRKMRARDDCAHPIPIPFLQVIQAVASLAAADLVSFQQPPDRMEKQKRGEESNIAKFREGVLPTQLQVTFPFVTQPIELHCNNVDNSKVTEKPTDNKHIQHNEVEVVSPVRNCNISLVEAASPCFHDSRVEWSDETESPCLLGSPGLNYCVDKSHTYTMDAVLPSDNTQMLPAQQDAIDDRNRFDDERSITSFLANSTKHLSFVESPSKASHKGVTSDEDSIHDFEFPVHSYDDDDVDHVHVSEAATQGMEDKHDQEANARCKEKKAKKKKKKKQKKKKKAKRSRDFDDEDQRNCKRWEIRNSQAENTQVSKITPETVCRTKRPLRSPESIDPTVDDDAFFDPRVKRYNHIKNASYTVNMKHDTGETKTNAIVSPYFVQKESATKKYHNSPEPGTPMNFPSFDDDGLEIPHESPEPPTKLARHEGIGRMPFALPMTVGPHDQESSEFHILCSESFVESFSQVIASLASGSWLVDRQIGDGGEKGDNSPCYRIMTYDLSLLDEIGIDMEIAGKGAILVYRLSNWGRQEDLKVLIRELVKLSALGRYLTLHVIICVDVVLSPSLAKDIAFVQSTPLGNTDCIVSFNLVAPRALADVIAHKVYWARNRFPVDIDGSTFYSLCEIQGQASFLLRLISSLTVGDVILLLRGKNGRSVCTLKQILKDSHGSTRSDVQLQLAAHAQLNQIDS